MVRAMCRRFPGAVDKLPEERAHFGGPPPTCLAATDLNAAADALFVAEVGRRRVTRRNAR